MLNRPKIICHMTSSIDGKATGNFLFSDEAKHSVNKYYEINRNLSSSFICGRVTMEESFTGKYYPDISKFENLDVPDGDYTNNRFFERFAIAFDSCGKLGWKDNVIHDIDPGYDGCYILEVLTKKAPKEYLAYLRSLKIPYIICGENEIDINLALKKLYHSFGIKKAILEGGPHINESFLKLGLVDELKIVIAPIIAEKGDNSLFNNGYFSSFSLLKNEVVKDTVVLQYTKNRNPFSTKFNDFDIRKTIEYYNKEKGVLSSCSLLKETYDTVLDFLHIDKEKLDYTYIKQSNNQFASYIEIDDCIHPLFLKFLPTITGIDSSFIHKLAIKEKIIYYEIEAGCFHFVDINKKDSFENESYIRYRFVDYIKYLIKNITVDNMIKPYNDITRAQFFKIIKEKEFDLNDIFINKVLVAPFLSNLIDNKESSNTILCNAFLNLLYRSSRYKEVKSLGAPDLILDAELIFLQTYLNNYYDLIL